MSGLTKLRNKANANKLNIQQGGINAVPIPFDRFSKKMESIPTGMNLLITAETGVGKTQLAKYLMFYWLNFFREKNIQAKVIYNSLETSEEMFWAGLISQYIAQYNNITISPIDVLQTNRILDSKKQALVDNAFNAISVLEDYIIVNDNIYNPTGLYKLARNVAGHVGKFINKGSGTVIQPEDINDRSGIYYYEKDIDKQLIIITDNLDLIEPEEGAETLWKAMRKWTKSYGVQRICKNFKAINLNLQQLAAQGEDDGRDRHYLPTLNKLGDNKQIARDMDFVWALFSPMKYKLYNHEGYDIIKLQDRFRSLYVLKDRHYGAANSHLPLYFRGDLGKFAELPKNILDYNPYL